MTVLTPSVGANDAERYNGDGYGTTMSRSYDNNNNDVDSETGPPDNDDTMIPEQKTTTSNNRRPRRRQYAVSVAWESQQQQNKAKRDFHSFFCCCAERVGNMFVLLKDTHGAPLVIAGPCWPFCCFVTMPLVLVLPFLLIYFVLIRDDLGVPTYMVYPYCIVLAITLFMLFCVSCRDPGLMERVTDEEAGANGGWFWNEQVASFRPPGALYCRECGVLIQNYDHLCPWTGTGIGHANMWAFKGFVASVNILCYFSLALVVWVLLDGLAM